jgi:hypothetical protein
MFGHDRKSQHGKTAIVLFDRVAFRPPAGHLTSSNLIVRIRGVHSNRPVQGGPKFHPKRRICRF